MFSVPPLAAGAAEEAIARQQRAWADAG
jgi:hypothetical protein